MFYKKFNMTGDMMIAATIAVMIATTAVMTVAMMIVDLIVIGGGAPHVGVIANNYAGLASLNAAWVTAVVIVTNVAAGNSFYA